MNVCVCVHVCICAGMGMHVCACVCACMCVCVSLHTKLQELLVEISDRSRKDPPVVYRIIGEVLVPGINTSDMASVFEEHRVCRQLGVLGQYRFHEVSHMQTCAISVPSVLHAETIILVVAKIA